MSEKMYTIINMRKPAYITDIFDIVLAVVGWDVMYYTGYYTDEILYNS